MARACSVCAEPRDENCLRIGAVGFIWFLHLEMKERNKRQIGSTYQIQRLKFNLCLVEKLRDSFIRPIIQNEVLGESNIIENIIIIHFLSKTKQNFSSDSFISVDVSHIFHHRPEKDAKHV